MKISRSAASCRWATPTLYLASPDWIEAGERPWTCLRDGDPRTMDTTEDCEDCPRWETQRRTGTLRISDVDPELR